MEVSFQRGIPAKESLRIGIDFYLNNPEKHWDKIPPGFYILNGRNSENKNTRCLMKIYSSSPGSHNWWKYSLWDTYTNDKKIVLDSNPQSIYSPLTVIAFSRTFRMDYIGGIETDINEILKISNS